MSDEQRPLHLQASDAVVASREARERAEARGPGPDVSDKPSTSAIVWGAFFGLIISAFQVDPKSPLTLILIPAFGMAFGAFVFWGVGRALRFLLSLPSRLLGGGKR